MSATSGAGAEIGSRSHMLHQQYSGYVQLSREVCEHARVFALMAVSRLFFGLLFVEFFVLGLCTFRQI